MKKVLFIFFATVASGLSSCSDTCCAQKCGDAKTKQNEKTTMHLNQEAPPLACSLSHVDKAERKKIIQEFSALIQEKKELATGKELIFEGSNENLEKIQSLIMLERQCCSFLTFVLKVGKVAEPIVLAITGPKGTQEFLAEELGID